MAQAQSFPSSSPPRPNSAFQCTIPQRTVPSQSITAAAAFISSLSPSKPTTSNATDKPTKTSTTSTSESPSEKVMSGRAAYSPDSAKCIDQVDKDEWFQGSGMTRGRQCSRKVDYYGGEWQYKVIFEFRGYAVVVKFNERSIAVFPASEDEAARMVAVGVDFHHKDNLPDNLRTAALLHAETTLPVDDEEEDGVLDPLGRDRRRISNGGFVYTG